MNPLSRGIFMLPLEHDSVIHEGAVPPARPGAVERLFHQRHDLRVGDAFTIIKEVMDEDGPDVSLDKGMRFIEYER